MKINFIILILGVFISCSRMKQADYRPVFPYGTYSHMAVLEFQNGTKIKFKGINRFEKEKVYFAALSPFGNTLFSFTYFQGSKIEKFYFHDSIDRNGHEHFKLFLKEIIGFYNHLKLDTKNPRSELNGKFNDMVYKVKLNSLQVVKGFELALEDRLKMKVEVTSFEKN